MGYEEAKPKKFTRSRVLLANAARTEKVAIGLAKHVSILMNETRTIA